jgi:regulator of nucleoside diphosphate kinase
MTLPSIVISKEDRDRLMSVATSALTGNRTTTAASTLLSEIGRANILAGNSVPQDVVRMGSEVEIRDDIRQTCSRVRLVYPDEVATARNDVSVLTRLGIALIGLSEGASMQWCTATGDPSKITVLRVFPQRKLSARSRTRTSKWRVDNNESGNRRGEPARPHTNSPQFAGS